MCPVENNICIWLKFFVNYVMLGQFLILMESTDKRFIMCCWLMNARHIINCTGIDYLHFFFFISCVGWSVIKFGKFCWASYSIKAIVIAPLIIRLLNSFAVKLLLQQLCKFLILADRTHDKQFCCSCEAVAAADVPAIFSPLCGRLLSSLAV